MQLDPVYDMNINSTTRLPACIARTHTESDKLLLVQSAPDCDWIDNASLTPVVTLVGTAMHVPHKHL